MDRLVDRRHRTNWLEGAEVDQPSSGIELREEGINPEPVSIAFLCWLNGQDSVSNNGLS